MKFDSEVHDARRRVFMKKALEVVGWLAALLIFALAGHNVLAAEQEGRDRPRGTEAEPVRPAAAVLHAARRVYVRPGKNVDAKYLEYKLQRQPDFGRWGLVVVEDERAADLVVKVDRALLNYVFSVVDPRTSAVVVSGKVVALNRQLAAEYLGAEIIKRMHDVRESSGAPPRWAAGDPGGESLTYEVRTKGGS